jgi:hypothetical protein
MIKLIYRLLVLSFLSTVIFGCGKPAPSVLNDSGISYEKIRCFHYLEKNKSEALKCLALIKKNLSDPSPTMKIGAMRVICVLGADAEECTPELINLLNDKDKTVKLHAILALGSIGVSANSSTDELIKLVQAQDPDIAKAAIDALGNIDAHDKDSVALLEFLLTIEKDLNLSWSLKKSLNKITGKTYETCLFPEEPGVEFIVISRNGIIERKIRCLPDVRGRPLESDPNRKEWDKKHGIKE